jgi:hypothetical protein
MKNILLIIKPLILLVFLFLNIINLQSQGEWQWAKSYSGQDDNMNGGLYNQITRSVYDSQGNIYIAGTMGENAFLDNDENLSEGPMMGYSSVLLSKFDPQGNLLWKRSIKNSQYDSYTNWMEIVGDTSIVLLANVYSPGGNNVRLWYLDTLIVGQYPNPPTYPTAAGHSNCFITFDLDGNKQSEYFLKQRQYNSEGTTIYGGKLVFDKLAPLHIDKNGYIYISANIVNFNNNADTLKVIINDQKTFTCGSFSMSSNAWLLKFTPDFDLVWSKQLVRDTSGIGNENSLLTNFSTYPTGITVDEEENLYLTGYIDHYRSDDSSYYREVHLGAGKKLILNDAGCDNLGFIIKYDTTGEPIWANQVFGKKKVNVDTSITSAYTTTISTSSINKDNNCIYISGYAYHSLAYILNNQLVYDSTICKLYFDDGTQLLFETDTSTGTPKKVGLFFAKLNKETGRYISHGVTNGVFFQRQSENSFVARNNQVIKKLRYIHHLKGIDSVYHTGGVTYPGFAIVRWMDNGELIEVNNIPVFADPGKTRDGNTIMNDNGDLFITGMYSNNISFGDISLNGSSGRSNAFMAKYTDTTFLHPYLSTAEDIAIENSNNLIIYPNPAYNEVNIKAQGEMIIDFSLYNMNGQLIFMKNNPKAKTEKLSLFLLPKGVYILKVRTHKNVYTRKVIRN